MRECIAVLSGFRELLRAYGLAPKDARVIATSALREAANRDTFVDRVSLQTGFRVTVIEDIEENHLMYLGVQHALQADRGLLTRYNAMILEVGGGSTEIMLLGAGAWPEPTPCTSAPCASTSRSGAPVSRTPISANSSRTTYAPPATTSTRSCPSSR